MSLLCFAANASVKSAPLCGPGPRLSQWCRRSGVNRNAANGYEHTVLRLSVSAMLVPLTWQRQASASQKKSNHDYGTDQSHCRAFLSQFRGQ
eukprot:1203149-Rhodomonas_salina.3